MLNQLNPTARQLKRALLAAPLTLALALTYPAAQAQVAPTPAPPRQPAPTNGIYYIDGKLASSAELAKIDPNIISHIQIIKGANQQKVVW